MASAFDPGFTLIPADEGATVDEQIDAALAGLVPTTDPDVKQPLGRGWAFDFETGQLIAHGSAPANVFATDQLRVWIEKTLRTARFAHVIYSDQYGVDNPYHAVIGRTFTPGLAGQLADGIRAALLVHDRITAVTDFTFDGGPESSVLLVSFRVVLDDAGENELEFNQLALGGP